MSKPGVLHLPGNISSVTNLESFKVVSSLKWCAQLTGQFLVLGLYLSGPAMSHA